MPLVPHKAAEVSKIGNYTSMARPPRPGRKFRKRDMTIGKVLLIEIVCELESDEMKFATKEGCDDMN